MRWMIAATAALCMASAAVAQPPTQPVDAPAATTPAPPPSRCPDFPPEPDLPDGGTTRSRQDMNRGNERYQAWGQQMQSVLECRRAEAQELRAAAQAAIANAETRVAEFNAAVARLTAVGNAWQAEAEEFNSRGGRR